MPFFYFLFCSITCNCRNDKNTQKLKHLCCYSYNAISLLHMRLHPMLTDMHPIQPFLCQKVPDFVTQSGPRRVVFHQQVYELDVYSQASCAAAAQFSSHQRTEQEVITLWGAYWTRTKWQYFLSVTRGIHRWLCKRLENAFNSPNSEFPLVSGTVSSPTITHEISPCMWQ